MVLGRDLESQKVESYDSSCDCLLPSYSHPNLPALNPQVFQNHVSKNQPFISV